MSGIVKKAQKLIDNKAIFVTYYGKNKHFLVKGVSRVYSVIKTGKGLNCDCFYFSNKLLICSHIYAVELYLENLHEKTVA